LLILNAGAPVETVQLLLGHKHIETTLGYARVYDGTAAADYYNAMRLVESRLDSPDKPPPPSAQEMLVLVDSLLSKNDNRNQIAILNTIRSGILASLELDS
jgi:hypothetical protein